MCLFRMSSSGRQAHDPGKGDSQGPAYRERASALTTLGSCAAEPAGALSPVTSESRPLQIKWLLSPSDRSFASNSAKFDLGQEGSARKISSATNTGSNVDQGGLGTSYCPGKQVSVRHMRPWTRNLQHDLAAIKQAGVTVIVCLLNESELRVRCSAQASK